MFQTSTYCHIGRHGLHWVGSLPALVRHWYPIQWCRWWCGDQRCIQFYIKSRSRALPCSCCRYVTPVSDTILTWASLFTTGSLGFNCHRQLFVLDWALSCTVHTAVVTSSSFAHLSPYAPISSSQATTSDNPNEWSARSRYIYKAWSRDY